MRSTPQCKIIKQLITRFLYPLPHAGKEKAYKYFLIGLLLDIYFLRSLESGLCSEAGSFLEQRLVIERIISNCLYVENFKFHEEDLEEKIAGYSRASSHVPQYIPLRFTLNK